MHEEYSRIQVTSCPISIRLLTCVGNISYLELGQKEFGIGNRIILKYIMVKTIITVNLTRDKWSKQEIKISKWLQGEEWMND